MFFYKTDKFSGTIKSSDEDKVFWVKRNKLSKMKLAYDTDKNIQIIEEEFLSEFYYYKEKNEWKYKFI